MLIERIKNTEGESVVIIRWKIETPEGWIGAYNRDALDYLTSEIWMLSKQLEDSNYLHQASIKRIDELKQEIFRLKEIIQTKDQLLNHKRTEIRKLRKN